MKNNKEQDEVSKDALLNAIITDVTGLEKFLDVLTPQQRLQLFNLLSRDALNKDEDAPQKRPSF